ncbi:MAG: outer membrane lipoprotein carrier protein LolA [Bryobacteraceae bacterium]
MRIGTLIVAWAGLMCCGLAPAAPDAVTLDGVLTHMDRAAQAFQGMTATMKRLTHTAVINDDSEQSGILYMRRTHAHEVEGLWNVAPPDQKTYEFRHRTLRIYLPKIKTVQIFDISKYGNQVDQFTLLGFATARAELEKDYTIRLLDHETVAGAGVAHLELTPKSAEVLENFKTIELWISDDNGYPVREKLNQNSGDYTIVTYSDLKLSPVPSEKELELNLPPGVEKTYPGK